MRRKLPKRESIIDMHCHGRDMNQRQKITVSQLLKEASASGVSIIGYMPNTDEPITSISVLDRYLEICYQAYKEAGAKQKFYIWFGATDNNQKEAEKALEYDEVIGTKLYPNDFSGENVTTGKNIGVALIGSKMEHMVLARQAGKPTAHHCDCPSILGFSICAEIADLATAIALAHEVKGSKVLICHVSNAQSAGMVKFAYEDEGLDIAMELMPHYLWFDCEGTNWDPDLGSSYYECRNKLRPSFHRSHLKGLLKSKLKNIIISSDSACHSIVEKKYLGLPGIPSHQHMVPVICTLAEELKLSDKRVAQLISWNASDFFGIKVDRKLEEVELEERIDESTYNKGKVVNPWKGSKFLFPQWK